jgi:hypothetical protein
MNEDAAAFLAPITLLFGGALVALGLLSFLNLNFFKSKLRAQGALVVGLVFLFATEALFVTSSGSGRYFSGQQIDVTDCEYEAEQANPLERGKQGHVIGEAIKTCMDRLGYEWTEEHPHCAEAITATNTFCYLPKAAFSRTIVAFQMKFE